MSNERFYKCPESAELSQAMDRADRLKAEIDRRRPLDENLWKAIQAKLRAKWTYDSNAIEGSTLTLGETIFFLQEGLTVEGKPLKDYLDARNHAEAIDLAYDVVRDDRPIGEGLIKELNALLLQGVKHTTAQDQFGREMKKQARPGQYKLQPNHVLQADGTVHRYVEPEQVTGEMEELCRWINQPADRHPIFVAALAHFNMVRIHPFDDGNGRSARLLMNIILIKAGYPPAVIPVEKRRAYLEALAKADSSDKEGFVRLVTESLNETQEMILADLG